MNFKLAKSFEEGAANRSFYKDRSDRKSSRLVFSCNAYSREGAANRRREAHEEQSRDL